MNNTKLALPSDQDASGRTLGLEEIEAVSTALRSGTLTSTKGQFTKGFENDFGKLIGADHAFAVATGSGALQTAFAAINPEPGEEIVTTAITDMGAISTILYQSAVPVFADVDPATCNVTADTIERVLSDRTRAIVATHLFGNPCDMDPIMELAKNRGIPVIEDCAQAFLATYKGRTVGTIGDIGCFSLQQGKHITTGEGGIVVSNNPDFARHAFLFINKAWGYGDPQPDHYFLAPNNRMSELQGAVASAQLPKLEDIVARRRITAQKLTEILAPVRGIATPAICGGATHVYWKFTLHLDTAVFPGGAREFGQALLQQGVACAPRYIQKPAFECEVIKHQRTFGESRFPFNLARPEALEYQPERFPGTYEGLDQIIVLPWNEHYDKSHVDHIADAIMTAANGLRNAA